MAVTGARAPHPAPDDDTARRVARAMGWRIVAWRRVVGGYTPADRYVVTSDDGATAFVKLATEPMTAEGLRAERRVYDAVHGPFLPRMLAFEDGPLPLLALEDLSAARWPPPWRAGDVDAVLASFDATHRAPPPVGTPPLVASVAANAGWTLVEADPAPFLALGWVSPAWLRSALPTLRAAERAMVWDGDAFLHLDVRSDNVCFRDGRAVFVDWNFACVGNPAFDLGCWLPSLHAEGGPPPEAILPQAPEVAAVLAGYFAARAGLPPPRPGSRVRDVQRQQLSTALPWACRALGLAVP